MPSPFPGMNPFLERESIWSTFRLMFISHAHFHIQSQLPKRYVGQLGSRTYTTEPPLERRLLDVPDVEKCYHLLIRDLDADEVVTIVEFLSPVNKYPGAHRERYLAIRNEILQSQTNFIEIDLLRDGPRMPPSDELPPCDYGVVVSRVGERPRSNVSLWCLRDPMPSVPIPLRAGMSDVTLDLKAVIDRVYDGAGFANYIYTGPPEPRLAPDDMAWASQFLPNAKS